MMNWNKAVILWIAVTTDWADGEKRFSDRVFLMKEEKWVQEMLWFCKNNQKVIWSSVESFSWWVSESVLIKVIKYEMCVFLCVLNWLPEVKLSEAVIWTEARRRSAGSRVTEARRSRWKKRKGELIGADYTELKTSVSFPGGILIAPGGPSYRPRAVINTTPAIKRTERHREQLLLDGPGCRNRTGGSSPTWSHSERRFIK